MSIAEQTITLLAANNGVFDGVAIESVKDAQAQLLSVIEADHKAIVKDLNTGAKPDEKAEKTILKAAEKVAKGFKG